MTLEAHQTKQTRAKVDRLCNHTYLPDLLNVDSAVLDLGANRGEFSHGMISRFACKVFAVEPHSGLRANIEHAPRLTLVPVGVSGRSQRVRLLVFGNRCASLLHQKEGDVVDSEEEVEVLDFRSLLERIGAERIDLMKVDIEGAEVEMFDSASDSDLQRCIQITVEFHDFVYPEQGARVELIKRRMRALGFWVINFSLDNTDVLFVNAAASGVARLQYIKLKYITKYLQGIPRRFRAWQRVISLGRAN
jgi:FkbM family methyltransferase